MKVRIRAVVRPTESCEKVKQAIRNLFDVELREEKEGERLYVVGESDEGGLSKFRRLLFGQRILDAARQFMLNGLTRNGFTFYLNKQAAYVGVISFCTYELGESPLGPIVVEVQCDDPHSAILWLAPRTVQGTPIEEVASPPDP